MDKVKTPVMLQYTTIKEQHPDCLLFFRLGDFYELFFEDAKIASAALDIVLTCRGKNTSEPVPMCGVPFHASDNYIARLIKKGFRVALCEQMETPSTKQSKGPIKREVVRIITSGTITEDNLLEARTNSFLMAIFPKDGYLGIGFVDISTGDFFIETQPVQALQSVLMRLQPQEILVPDKFIEDPMFFSCWKEWKNKITTLPISRFDMGEQRIASFFNVSTIKGFGNFSPIEISAAGGLLDYILLTQKKHFLMLSRPRKLEKRHFLEIDAFTRRNLEITQSFSGEKRGSLIETLDCTTTAIGGRMLFLRLTNPLKEIDQIQERLSSVGFFVKHNSERRAVRDMLAAIPDIERALCRLFMGRGMPKDMGAINFALKILPSIFSLLSSFSLPKELAELFAALEGHPEIASLLQRALNEDLPLFVRDGGIIATGYNEQLDELRNLQEQSAHLIRTLQEKYVQETQISTLRIRHNQIIGHYIEISTAAVSKVPFHFILKQTLASGSRFTTSELTNLEQKLLSANDDARQLEEKLFEGLIQKLKEYSGALKLTIQAIGLYDVSSALAELAVANNYVMPTLDDSNDFLIQGGRHPVVEKCLTTAFVKNSCTLTKDLTMWLITGPNMAGKSTFLRQNALIALMTHMGSFVPAEKAHMGIMDRIFSRVGASDDLARGHSTFMVEMIETATILNQASEKSFVILDEVGRGTATYDGLSLAWACIEYLIQSIKCRTLFATHYHELEALKNQTNIGFHTMKVKEWERNIVFLHEIIPGVADRSYGLHVAKLAGIPESILHRAESILYELEQKSTVKGSMAV